MTSTLHVQTDHVMPGKILNVARVYKDGTKEHLTVLMSGQQWDGYLWEDHVIQIAEINPPPDEAKLSEEIAADAT
jgi:hypothetical protein